MSTLREDIKSGTDNLASDCAQACSQQRFTDTIEQRPELHQLNEILLRRRPFRPDQRHLPFEGSPRSPGDAMMTPPKSPRMPLPAPVPETFWERDRTMTRRTCQIRCSHPLSERSMLHFYHRFRCGQTVSQYFKNTVTGDISLPVQPNGVD